MTPEIILFCEGGVIQSISANCDAKIYILDRDILEDSDKEFAQFKDRAFYPDGIFDEPQDWEKEKEEAAEKWDGMLN